MGLKKCSRCGRTKSLESFNVRVSVKNGVVPKAWCIECETDPTRKISENEKQARKERQTIARYGITVEQVQEMGKSQEWKCWICSVDISEKYYIDHNHVTGAARSLLCFHCNVGLGHFMDRTDLLANAIAYLQWHNNKGENDG